MRADSAPTPRRRSRALRSDAVANREKILTVAAELISQRGHQVPLAEIAEAAGVGVGTLYRGWPDRVALLHALEHRAYRHLIAILDRIEEAGQTGAEAVETYLHESLNLGNQLVLPLRGAPPLFDDDAVAARARIFASVERFLADGKIDGSVRVEVHAPDVVYCAAQITNPAPDTPELEQLARRHIALFVHSIRSPADEPFAEAAVTPRDIERSLNKRASRYSKPATEEQAVANRPGSEVDDPGP